MSAIDELFEGNRVWASRITRNEPDFFESLAAQQSPRYLWIGCSDSRVPANEIVGLRPGEMFVHRNVANLVVPGDLNCLTVLQYAVDVLKVEHVIACGHYGCGGVRAAYANASLGLIDIWLQHVRDVRDRNQALLAALDGEAAVDRLCELNVISQVQNLSQTATVRDAWGRGQSLAVHGVIYALRDGLLRDLEVSVDGSKDRAAPTTPVL